MHGTCHDFVVLNTIKDGHLKPTGHSGGDTVLNVTGQLFPVLKETMKFKKVLEIGSLDICGSQKTYNYCGAGPTWRSEIGNPEWIGIDITPGNEVDLVMDAHDIKFPDEEFDFVICLEMLEHDTDAQKTLEEAYRVLQPGGLFLLATVDETHPEHGSGPGGYYRHITENELRKWLVAAGFEKFDLVHRESDLFVRAIK